MDKDPFNEIFSSGGMRVALIGSLSILALFLLAQTITLAKDFGRAGTPATDTITVNGDGQATLPPDVARVSFTVENIAIAVADAQAATTKQANAVIDFVKGQGIADKDVKTLSYNISPQYSYANRTPKVTGYQVSETVQVTVRDLASVGALLGGLGDRGVQNVQGPAFALDDPTAGSDAARADAINKAKIQANLLAKQLGVHLGKIVNFSESSGGYAYPTYATGMMKVSADTASVPAPSVPVGQNTYNASVSITYEIR